MIRVSLYPSILESLLSVVADLKALIKELDRKIEDKKLLVDDFYDLEIELSKVYNKLLLKKLLEECDGC